MSETPDRSDEELEPTEEEVSEDEAAEAADGAAEEDTYEEPQRGPLVRWLLRMAEFGNKLPDPLTLFVILAALVILASVVFDGASEVVTQRDGSQATKTVGSLLSVAGIRWMLTSAVKNFIEFAPLGPVLAVMIGIGVAERTGFIAMGLRVLVKAVPSWALTTTLVFAGVMSSMAADAGYVVLTPLGAVLFAGLGRHPIAGLAAAFAGVSGGFSANLLITGLDPLLSNLTKAAAATQDPVYAQGINAAANYYFMIASVFLITFIGTIVTTRVVEPMLGKWDPADAADGEEAPSAEEPTPEESRHFLVALGAGALTTILCVLLVVVPGAGGEAPLMTADPNKDALGNMAPFFGSLEVLITAIFFVPGLVYGVLRRTIKNDKDVAKMASASMSAMGAYIVLAFVAGQFVAYFNHTNLGPVSAVRGARLLESLGLEGTALLLMFVAVSSTMNFFVGSASAKWAFMAPIFVPMLMLSGLSPELVQAGYRVGDSVTNIISPLMPYLPIIIVFAQKYDRRAGLGTIISAMVPYSIAFAIGWTIMLVVWLYAGLPLGPGVEAFYVKPGG
jgi:aminobenzoyl-glutamate transport protein